MALCVVPSSATSRQLSGRDSTSAYLVEGPDPVCSLFTDVLFCPPVMVAALHAGSISFGTQSQGASMSWLPLRDSQLVRAILGFSGGGRHVEGRVS